MRKIVTAIGLCPHTPEMIDCFRDSCRQLASFISDGDGWHGVSFLKEVTPVTYFGRLTHRNLRVLTVGLNPSWSEFDDETGVFARKNHGIEIRSLNECSESVARAALDIQNNYFCIKRREDRFRGKYFESIEPFLNLFGVSYYDSSARSLAAHVDVLTPFSTEQPPKSLPINKASDKVKSDGWRRFKAVVAAARTAELMIVIGSGVDSFGRYGDAPLKHRADGDYFQLETQFIEGLRVIGNSSWGGRWPNMPQDDSKTVARIRAQLEKWGVSLRLTSDSR